LPDRHAPLTRHGLKRLVRWLARRFVRWLAGRLPGGGRCILSAIDERPDPLT